MKVAFIGNMNNNHFAMMRYFRDLGIDAYLFKFANELDHFLPECDTYEYAKWAPYVIETKIINGDYKQYLKLKSSELYDLYSGYDFYIGNGFSPAYFHKAGLKLDLFLPYSVGIEYTYKNLSKNILDKIKEKLISRSQINGIKNSVRILGTVDAKTYEKAILLGVNTKKIAIPMVYNRSTITNNSEYINEFIAQINNYSFKVFSHVSHFPYDSLAYKIKRNDILINAFAKYIKSNPTHDSLLILFDYGRNVKGSKNMIAELGISKNVLWLPKLERKEIMSIIEHIDLGAGEFGGYFWGGTGWEFLSKGKLFFQYVDMTNEKIEEITQMAVPPFLNTSDSDFIATKIQYFYNQRQELKDISAKILDWFDENAGLSLAKKYFDLIQNELKGQKIN